MPASLISRINSLRKTCMTIDRLALEPLIDRLRASCYRRAVDCAGSFAAFRRWRLVLCWSPLCVVGLRPRRVHQPGRQQGRVGRLGRQARAGRALRALRVHGGRGVSAQGARGRRVRRVPGRHRVRAQGRGAREPRARHRRQRMAEAAQPSTCVTPAHRARRAGRRRNRLRDPNERRLPEG